MEKKPQNSRDELEKLVQQAVDQQARRSQERASQFRRALSRGTSPAQPKESTSGAPRGEVAEKSGSPVAIRNEKRAAKN
jgi:hypothetical protein